MPSLWSVRSTLADWSLGLVGSAMLGLAAGQLVVDRDRIVGDILETAVPVAIGLIIIAAAVWLNRQDADSDERLRLAGWSLVFFVALTLLAAWEAFLTFREGRAPVDELGYQVVMQAAAGALTGSVVGYYEFRQRQARADARLAQTAVETSRDGIAVIDADGAVLEANEAFAAMFGREVEDLLSETVSVCFTEGATDRLKADARPALVTTGEWRAELTGERADGETFPVDTSLSALPDREGAVLVARDITDRKRYEETIRALNGASRDLMAAESETEVAELVVQTGRTLLGRDFAGIWLVDDDGERLVPETMTPGVGEHIGDVVVDVDDGSTMSRAFTDGETLVKDRIEGTLEHADTDVVDSSVFVPLGAYGVLVIASRSPAAFDEDAVTLSELLGADATVALERAERERALQRQTERLEFFNSILRHDVLNGLTVIRTRADVLSRADDPETREQAETILEWCDDVSDIVTRVRRVIETLTGGETELEPVDLSGTLRAELDRLDSTYPAVTCERSVPDDVTVWANELLGEVLGNVLTNAVEHNDAEGLTVSVSVTTDGDTVECRIADTGSGIPDERKSAVFRRGETGHAKATGSGFGLFFVDAMVEQYGGTVRIEDVEPSGTAFVITLDDASEH